MRSVIKIVLLFINKAKFNKQSVCGILMNSNLVKGYINLLINDY